MPSGAGPAAVRILPAPVKARGDVKDYRVLELPNGLKALLISDCSYDLDKLDQEENEAAGALMGDQGDDDDDSSDPDMEVVEDGDDDNDDDVDDDVDVDDGGSIDGDKLKKSASGLKKSAAGLCVGAGSFSDPADLPGMAHFLEHMVFMGSKKYPDENHFDKFISNHGGSDNAHTECQTTTFYFETQRKHFREALDIFAQFFIDPLMRKEAMKREREAVDSEFQMSLPSDQARKQQIFGSLAKKDHPMTKFMWGNLASLQMGQLSDDEVHKKLHAFWERHYSAGWMTLVVQSQDTLDKLQDWVVESFGVVRNNGLEKESFVHLSGPFDTEKFRKLYKVDTTQDTHQLELTWALPSMVEKYRASPMKYIECILGHEGKGSLISYLRKKVWALSLMAGNEEGSFEHNSTYSAMTVHIVLTKDGFEKVDKVLEAVFSYIRMMREAGAVRRIYDEIKKIAELDFEFGPDEQPIDNVQDLSECMQLYTPEHYLTGGNLIFDYEPDLINDCLQRLTPADVNIMILAKEYGEDATEIEPWFKTRYSFEDVPATWKDSWLRVEVLPEFFLPEPNIYIAENTSLLEPAVGEAVSKLPIKIVEEPGGELFYRQDDIFKQPRAIALFSLRSPLAKRSVEDAVCLDLLVTSLAVVMVEDTYSADQALLEHLVWVGEGGEMSIKISGLNDKLPLLLPTIMTHISEIGNNLSHGMFEAVRAQTKKNYFNAFIEASKLVKDIRLSVLEDVHWTTVEKHEVVGAVDLDQVKAFSGAFFQSLFVQGLIQGNVRRHQAVSMYESVKKIILNRCGSNQYQLEVPPQLKCAKLQEGGSYLRVKGFNPKDTNSLITSYYQYGPGKLKEHMLLEVAALLMEEPVFDILRTKEQLGYAVYSTLRNTHGILGLSITVNSQASKFTIDHVDSRIEAFIDWFIDEKLAKLSDQVFKGMVTTLIKMKKAADVTLSEEVHRNWEEIFSQDYFFNRLSESIVLLEGCDKQEMINLVVSILRGGNGKSSGNRKKFCVQVVGNPDGIKVLEASSSVTELDPDSRFQLQFLPGGREGDKGPEFKPCAASFKSSLVFYEPNHITK